MNIYNIARLIGRVKHTWSERMELNEKLKELRKNKNMTQKAVATKVGLNVRQYQKYENGEQVPTSTVLSRLCHFFKVPSGYFLGQNNDIINTSHIYKNNDMPIDIYLSLLEDIYDLEQDFFSVDIKNQFEYLKDQMEKLNEMQLIMDNIDKKISELKANTDHFKILLSRMQEEKK